MADKTAILSVGIDVGTSTTHVVFSKLQMDNAGGYFSVPRVAIVDKEVVYKSEVYMTPLKTDVLIDTDALRDIVAAEFRKAGYRPEDTDSGAVIITGESARKENSDAVLKSLSDFAGDFVVSAAGPDMESLIAGKGSGAWQYSMDHHCRQPIWISVAAPQRGSLRGWRDPGQRLSGYRWPVNLYEPTGHHYESQSGGSGDGAGGRRVRFCRRQMR
ncbi:MAG: ethanolamine ammonia-lyase reactivating factor EutA [Coprococcus sp.]